MARHDYRCHDCHTISEHKDPMVLDIDAYDGEWIIDCPKCGMTLATRLPSAPNFTIKGYSAKTGYSSK